MKFKPNTPRGHIIITDLAHLSDRDRGWVAGFFEGEGCIYLSQKHYPAMVIHQTDLDVLRRFEKLVGGKVTENIRPPDHKKPIHRWAAYGWPSTKNFYEAVKDELGQRRREKFKEVLKLQPKYKMRPKSCGVDPTIPSSAGYKRHYKRGEVPCADCCSALNLLQSETRRQRKKRRAA